MSAFADKVVVVTGSSSGIGESTAHRMANKHKHKISAVFRKHRKTTPTAPEECSERENLTCWEQ